MSMADAIKNVFSNYATFEGRARRSEYWYFVVFCSLVSFVLTFIWYMVTRGESSVNVLGTIWGLATLVPSLAVGTRRLHDTGNSGWFLLLNLIPCVGTIIVLVFMATDSQPGTNQYGPNPKGM